ncbi:hypothetical protein LY474_12195 [Myxococcus stipitatus]|uniref:hypothetical protein n=1 Tax=Myxococcus stipitatus TaxID=83455 RepID=UPI001F37DE4D|nr:hypothetical protein [Myxococcus stipitatus]MCE9668574.1 hypothetical protein [Myxococcus stipitatus]
MPGLRRRASLAWGLGVTLGLLTRADLQAADVSAGAAGGPGPAMLASSGPCATGGEGLCDGAPPLAFSVTWSRMGDADLIVTTPTGKRVYYQNPGPGPGTDYGALERDDRFLGPETISWAPGTPPPAGVYHACLFLSSFLRLPSPSAPVGYSLVVRRPGLPDQVFQGRFIVRVSSVACDPTQATYIGSIHYP